MDFFQSQDHARRNTRMLVVLFAAAVVCIVVLVNLLVMVAGSVQDSQSIATGGYHYSAETFLAVSGIVLVLIGLGSVYRVMSLSGGGERVAEMMEGRRLSRDSADLQQRRVLNVVEEMAIAAGTPVPPVYLIPDAAINAFAAGYAPGDAIIGVTQGAVENLNRDQLQGVIAHEFSHILNGDMRLNIRLMGVLYGILMLSVIGRILLRSGGRRTGSRRDSGGAILAIGLGLMVVGYAGLFFGNLIKAAVSRQREFLADASAVQFTRNPDGIGGALQRIGGYADGSVLSNAKCEEFSHALFAQGVRVMFASLMATHPPLEERIRRILPHWDGSFLRRTTAEPKETPGATASPLAAMGAAGFGMDGATTVGTVGKPAAAHIEHARAIMDAFPPELAAAAREPYSARALAYLMLLDTDEAVRSVQLKSLEANSHPAVLQRLAELIRHGGRIDPRMRLPLLELAVPSLRQLTEDQYRAFIANVDALIRADQKIGMSEWALQKFVTRHLGAAFLGKRSTPRFKDFTRVHAECACLLSILAYADTRGGDPARAFQLGVEKLGFEIELLDRSELDLEQLDRAVDTLAELRPLIKPRLLKACVATIAADGVVTPVEEELVRTIADVLDCPMPPISTGMPGAA